MLRTGVSDWDVLFFHEVTDLADEFTWIDCVFEIETTADGEALDDLDAHVGWCCTLVVGTCVGRKKARE